MSTTCVAVVGLGATGTAVAADLLDDPSFDLRSCVDIAPTRVGKRLRDLPDRRLESDLAISAQLTDIDQAVQVVLETTRSRLEECFPTYLALLRRGFNVVSSCEELSFPFSDTTALAEELDACALKHGVSILGTGLNPGFLMDVLPLVLSAPFRHIERVEIHRVLDMRSYDRAVLGRFGLGLDPDEFDRRCATGQLAGHVGFEQSLAQLVDTLKIRATIEPHPVVRELLAGEPRHGAYTSIAPGSVAITSHGATAFQREEAVIQVKAFFGFLNEDDEVRSGDRILVTTASSGSYEFRSTPGLPSIPSTAAMLVNMVQPVLAAPPGLRTMRDFAVGAIASKRFGSAEAVQ